MEETTLSRALCNGLLLSRPTVLARLPQQAIRQRLQTRQHLLLLLIVLLLLLLLRLLLVVLLLVERQLPLEKDKKLLVHLLLTGRDEKPGRAQSYRGEDSQIYHCSRRLLVLKVRNHRSNGA